MLDLAQSGVAMNDTFSPGHPVPLGQVDAAVPLPPVDELPLRDRSRNNQLALGALIEIRPAVDAAIERYGADRIGIVIGTSTSGIAESESALRQYATTGVLPEQFHYGQQELASPAAVLAAALGIGGPAYVHSSACASSAKVACQCGSFDPNGYLRCSSGGWGRFAMFFHRRRIQSSRID